MNRITTVLIDGEGFQVDQRVAVSMETMDAEIEALRNALVSLAVFVGGGDPCWCRCEGGEHSKACRAALKLRLWPRPSKGKPVNSDFVPWTD